MADARAAGSRPIRWEGPVAPVYTAEGILDLDWFGDLLERLKDFIRQVTDAIAYALWNALKPVLDRIDAILFLIQDFFNTRLAAILDAIAAIPNRLAELVEGILTRMSSYLDVIVEKLSSIYDNIVNFLQNAISSIISSFTTQLNSLWSKMQGFLEGIVDKIGEIADRIREFVGAVVDTLKTRIGDLVDGIREFAQRVVDGVKEFAQRVSDAITSAYAAVTERVRTVLQTILERIVKVVEHFRKRFEEIYTEIVEALQRYLVSPIRETSDQVKEIAQFKIDVLTRVAMGQYDTWDAFVADITDPLPVLGAVGSVLTALLIGAVVMPAASSAIEPALTNLMHLANEHFRPALLSPGIASTAYFRGMIGREELEVQLAKSGYPDRLIDVVVESNRPLPSPGAIQEAYLRKFISKAEHDRLLRKHGYTDDDIALFEQLYYIIPMPADLIRMAVREAFSPDVASKFGQYEDFPEEFAAWAEKQGLSREWAERYWAAHWDLPSATQGFEMLHRRIITREELTLLLRALDVMPFWREKLIQLSYYPYTRVDVRRMYQLGILDEEGVYESYLDLGYDPEKARNLTEFTIRYYTPEDKTELDEYRDITRSLVERAYEQGVLTRDEAIQRLKSLGYRDEDVDLIIALVEARMALERTREDPIPLRSQTTKLILASYERGVYSQNETKDALSALGYSDTEIEWYIAMTDYSVVQGLRNAMIDIIHQRYVTRIIDRTEAIVQLGPLIPTSEEQRRLLEQWDVEREARLRKPSEAQFRAALYAGLITFEEYKEELRGLGFDEKYVEMLASLAKARARE